MTAGGSAPVARGALVTVNAQGAQCSLPFQYNPETVRRTYAPNTTGGTTGASSLAVRFAAAATETLVVEACFTTLGTLPPTYLDAKAGIAPQLAALRGLVNPATPAVLQAAQLLGSGSVEVAPPLASPLLFVWGAQHVLPVRLTAMAVTEEFFDGALWPVRATVELTMQTLTYSDVDPSNPAYGQSIVYQQKLEALAQQALTPGSGSGS